jgi:hypothetical protein
MTKEMSIVLEGGVIYAAHESGLGHQIWLGNNSVHWFVPRTGGNSYNLTLSVYDADNAIAKMKAEGLSFIRL